MAIDQQNGDYNIYAGATVFNKTASADGVWELDVRVGDGTKNLHTNAATLTLTVTVAGETIGGGAASVAKDAGVLRARLAALRFFVANGEAVTAVLSSNNSNDTNVGVTVVPRRALDVSAAGYGAADLKAILGTALPAESQAGLMAASLSKFLDIANPVNTLNDLAKETTSAAAKTAAEAVDGRLPASPAAVGSEMTLSAEAVIAIEAVLADDTIGYALKQAVIDKLIENLPNMDDLSVAAIRDAVLNRQLAGNHDEAGTVGGLLQYLDAAITSRHAAGAAVAKSPATLDWSADVSNKPTIGTSNFNPATDEVTPTADSKSDYSLSAASLAELRKANLFTSSFSVLALANAPTGAAVNYSVSSAAVGAAPRVDITLYQNAAIGPLEITAATAQTGKSHALVVYDPAAPTTKLWSLTTAGGEISVGGGGDLVLTIVDDDSHTESSGQWCYVLWNTTDDIVICKGALSIEPVPEA